MKNLFSLFFVAFVCAASLAAAANVNFSVTNVAPDFNVTLGTWTTNYTLAYNVTVLNGTGGAGGNISNVNFTFFLPYGVNPGSPCNGTGGFYTSFFDGANLMLKNACNVTYASVNGSANFTLNVTANVSSFFGYYPYHPQLFYASATCASECGPANSASSSRYAVSFWRNPRPFAMINQAASPNVTITFNFWNQTDTFYQLQAPIETFNMTTKRPEFSNNSFAEIMYMNGSMMERPNYVRMYTYNMTFRLLFNGSNVTGSPQTIVLWNAVNTSTNNSATDACTWGGFSDCPSQSIMPVYTQTEEQTDYMSNTTFNMTMAVPAPNGYDVYINGMRYTPTQALALGFNASFTPGMMQNANGAFVLTATNSTYLDNTDITLLFTIMNQTYCPPGQGQDCQGLRPTSPVYIDWQSVEGNFRGPQFGANISVTYSGRFHNALSNYSLNNVSIEYFVPLNATFSPFYDNGTCCNWTANQSFNMTTGDNMSWNNTQPSLSIVGVTNRTPCMTLNDSKPGSPSRGLVLVCMRVWSLRLDVPLCNNWNPGSANSNVTVNFTAQLSFPVMAEDNYTPGTAGSTNSYNATFSPSMRTGINLTDKVPGIADAGCDNTIVTLDGTDLTCGTNYTIGSLTLNDVSSGMRQVSVTYTIPLAAQQQYVGGGTTPTPTPCPKPSVAGSVTPAPTYYAGGTPTPAPTVGGATATSTERVTATPALTAAAAGGVSQVQANKEILIAKEYLAQAQAKGLNVDEAKRLISLAENALRNGQYALALENAQLAQNALKNALASAAAVKQKAAGVNFTLVAVIIVLVLLGAAYLYYARKKKKGL